MRKFIGVFAAGIMAASLLAGCGSTSNSNTAASEASSAVSVTEPIPTGDTSVSTVEDTDAADSTDPAAEAASADDSGETAADTADSSSDGSHILVLYYSASGNTKKIADMIAADTGADEYEITPSKPYTSDDLNWSDKNSRVVREHEDESLQDVAFDSYDVPNWDSYDTVFVGYPIWWQDASWVMKSFVKNVDFTGKTVIPFATSSSSGLGESGKNLETLAGAGNWQDGQRFSGSASEDDVRNWVEGLGF